MAGQGDKKKQERKLLEIYAPLKIRNCTTAVKLLLYFNRDWRYGNNFSDKPVRCG